MFDHQRIRFGRVPLAGQLSSHERWLGLHAILQRRPASELKVPRLSLGGYYIIAGVVTIHRIK